MATQAYLGLDLGGTGAKAGVYGVDGVQLGFAQRGYQPVTDERGLTEIPVDQIYLAARDAVREAVKESGAQIRALAISSQGQTFVTLDIHDHPLHNAIIWYDARAGEQAEQMKQEINSEYICPLLEAVASAPKILWLRERYPEVMARAHRYLLLPDYIYYRLTGVAATDPCIAGSTGLYCDEESDYNETAIQAAGISKEQLAKILPSGTPFAKVTPEAASEWGLSEGVKAVIGTNDQYAGALGAGNCRPGLVSETTGTCLALVTIADKEPNDLGHGLIPGKFPIPGRWYILAYSKIAGVALDWFVKEFGCGMSHQDLDDLASGIPPGSNGISVLHHFDGFITPYLNINTRGHIHGISINTKLPDIYHGLLESVAFSSRQHVESYLVNGYPIEEYRCIGGGAKSDLWMQMKADVLNVRVERPSVVEAATLGAAMIASYGDGKYSSIKSASMSMHSSGKLFYPNPKNVSRYDEAYSKYLELFAKMY